MAMDMNEAVRRVVLQELERALTPHRDALTRLQAFLGAKPNGVSRTQERTAAAGTRKPKRARAGKARAKAKAKGRNEVKSAPAAGAVAEGTVVQYKQGRGTFQAKVVKVDGEAGMVHLRRENDGKRVMRKPEQLYAV